MVRNAVSMGDLRSNLIANMDPPRAPPKPLHLQNNPIVPPPSQEDPNEPAMSSEAAQFHMSDKVVAALSPEERAEVLDIQRKERSRREDSTRSSMQDLRKLPSMQLLGEDAYTKRLMNRVATGEATGEEEVAFNTMVNKLQTNKPKAGPSVSKQAEPQSQPQPTQHLGQQWTAPSPGVHELLSGLKLEDDAFMDYQEQLKLLEKQNKKRRVKGKAQPYPAFEGGNSVDHRRQILAAEEMEKLANGKPIAHHFLFKVPEMLTAADRAQVDHLWKSYLQAQAARRRQKTKVSFDGLEAREEAQRFPQATRENASAYTQPFCEFLAENPTVFHAVDSQKKQLLDLGWTELSERNKWEIAPGGRYFVERNGSSLIAFAVGEKYESGNGAAILAGHVDALTAKLKPISEVPNRAGYLQLGIAPYAGAPNNTWWDRDLGIGGKVLIQDGDKVVTKLVKLDWPIARIPTLAPHFGAAARGPFNPETQMVPIIGLEDTDASATEVQSADPFRQPPLLGGEHGPVGSFLNTQPRALVRAIWDALGMHVGSKATIINWELELFDVQRASVGGLNKEFIYAGRIDDKLCSWSAMQALIHSADTDTEESSIIKVVAWFDDEEIGSGLRQGAKGNFLPSVMERAVGSLAKGKKKNYANLMGRTYANSFLVSSDVTHAVNPNFLGSYNPQHSPHLNVGLCVSADSNGNMTTDAVSTAILKKCADKVGAKLQIFHIRSDSRGGGTVGPMLSSAMGVRAIDAGMPQLSMHSVRATTGALDPGLGVLAFVGFLSGFESVDKEFQE